MKEVELLYGLTRSVLAAVNRVHTAIIAGLRMALFAVWCRLGLRVR
jgi:hypothetical protein